MNASFKVQTNVYRFFLINKVQLQSKQLKMSYIYAWEFFFLQILLL